MKKLSLSVLALATVASFTACKKGEEDGALSLKSRKVRLAGEWTVSSSAQNVVSTSTYTDGVVTTTASNTSDGATVIEKSNTTSTRPGGFSSSSTTNGTATTATYSIKKDGTWSSKMVTNYTLQTSTFGTFPAQSTTLVKTETTEESGTWQFTTKNKGIKEKNKESVIMATTMGKVTTVDATGGGAADTDVSTYTAGINEDVTVWHLTQLKSKAMIADGVIDNVSDGSSASNGGTPVPNTKTTNKGTFKITFKQ